MNAKHLLAAFAVATATLVTPAAAVKIDLSTTSCGEFIAGKPDDIMITLAWLDAFYKDEDAPAVIDTEKFIANAKKLGEYCAANPTIGLITATDKLFGN